MGRSSHCNRGRREKASGEPAPIDERDTPRRMLQLLIWRVPWPLL
jgi:hypothetical protein